MARNSSISELCGRIAQVRSELHGPRGKAAFAKQLGLSPSTYNYYEGSRAPPADVLVRIADIGGVDLRWLLTGEASSPPVAADHPAVQQIARLLADHPGAVEPLTAFVDLLAKSFSWPAKGEPFEPLSVEAANEQPPPVSVPESRADWIPVLGRSAAGVPMFWRTDDQAVGVTALAELVERHAGAAGRRISDASAADDAGHDAGSAQIITLSAPNEDNIAEFVVAGTLRRRHADAFAVRIDGDSMAPDIRHGDLVICSAALGAMDGRAALVQLQGQIGVTCKIYRKTGKTVHLVPINDQYPPQAFDAGQVVWARRLLARVRAR